MNNISIMYSHCISHRSEVPEALNSIVGYAYFEHAVDLSNNNDASALLLLAQTELIPVRAFKTYVANGKRVWDVEFIGVIAYAGIVSIDVDNNINAAIQNAIDTNLSSDFRAMEIYLRSDRFYQFRMKMYQAANDKVVKYAETLKDKDYIELMRLTHDEANRRVDRIRQRIRKLAAKTNALKENLSGLQIETLMLTRLIEYGFFSLASINSVAVA